MLHLSIKQNRLLLNRLNSGSQLKNRQFSPGGVHTLFVGVSSFMW